MGDLTHGTLVEIARKWLFRKHSIVITEVMTGSGESPDAIGWHNGASTLVECKVNKSDWYADKKKYFRKYPEMGVGMYRYFLTPRGFLTPDALPENWGLVETDGIRIYLQKKAVPFSKVNYRNESVILMSLIRRIGQTKIEGVSINAYCYSTKNKATLTLLTDDVVPNSLVQQNPNSR